MSIETVRNALRSKLSDLLSCGRSHEDIQEEFCSIASKLSETGVDDNDMLMIVAKQVFGWQKPIEPEKKQTIAPIQELRQLMTTILIGHGVPDDQAKV